MDNWMIVLLLFFCALVLYSVVLRYYLKLFLNLKGPNPHSLLFGSTYVYFLVNICQHGGDEYYVGNIYSLSDKTGISLIHIATGEYCFLNEQPIQCHTG